MKPPARGKRLVKGAISLSPLPSGRGWEWAVQSHFLPLPSGRGRGSGPCNRTFSLSLQGEGGGVGRTVSTPVQNWSALRSGTGAHPDAPQREAGRLQRFSLEQ